MQLHIIHWHSIYCQEENKTEQKIFCSVCLTMHIALKRKTITRDRKINYSKKRANVKYYNYKKQKYITLKNKNILNITMQTFFSFSLKLMLS